MIDFILVGHIAEDPRKCGVECEVIWMSGSRESCKQQYWRTSNWPVLNRHDLNEHCTRQENTSKYRNTAQLWLKTKKYLTVL